MYFINTHIPNPDDPLSLAELSHASYTLQERIQKSQELMVTVVDDGVFGGKIAFDLWAQGGNVLHHCSMLLLKRRPADSKEFQTHGLGLSQATIGFIEDAYEKPYFRGFNSTADWCVDLTANKTLKKNKPLADLMEFTMTSEMSPKCH